MPIPLLSKYKEAAVSKKINSPIIESEKEIDTSLIPSIPSLNVLTTYSIGLASETDLQISGSIFIE